MRLLLLAVAALALVGCQSKSNGPHPSGGTTACTRIGQTCEVGPNKLGSCVQRDDCTQDCLVCQSQGLIQIAAALHKLVAAGSPDSAARLFAKGLAKLDALPADFEIDLAAFRGATRACARTLAEGRFDASLIPRLLSGGAHRA